MLQFTTSYLNKFYIPLPGLKKGEEEVKLFSKQDYKDKKGDSTRNHSPNSEYEEKAMYYLEGLGGKENIKDVTNCTTRLRLTVKDESKVQESAYFTHNQMSHGLVKSGKSVQVVVGMSVPQVREAFENIVNDDLS